MQSLTLGRHRTTATRARPPQQLDERYRKSILSLHALMLLHLLQPMPSTRLPPARQSTFLREPGVCVHALLHDLPTSSMNTDCCVGNARPSSTASTRERVDVVCSPRVPVGYRVVPPQGRLSQQLCHQRRPQLEFTPILTRPDRCIHAF